MSNTKPTDTGSWATDPSAELTAPSAGKKAEGWIHGKRAPARWMNWWMNAIYTWIAWFDEKLVNPVEATAGRYYLALRGDTGAGAVELLLDAQRHDRQHSDHRVGDWLDRGHRG